MKVKGLKLLPKHHPGGWGLPSGIVSWNDWVLEDINGCELILKTKGGLKCAVRESKVNFYKNAYNKLSGEGKKKINDIFKENKGNTIKMILELNFT